MRENLNRNGLPSRASFLYVGRKPQIYLHPLVILVSLNPPHALPDKNSLHLARRCTFNRKRPDLIKICGEH